MAINRRNPFHMQTVLTPARQSAMLRTPNFVLALIFWVFTYGLFAYRSQLRFGAAAELLTVDRLVSTLLGAAIYWFVLSWLIDGTRNRPGKPMAVLATILPASIVMLLARVLLDHFVERPLPGFHNDLRFVMVWSGYFGLWVSASFALRLLPIATTIPATTATAARPIPISEAHNRANGRSESAETWDIVIDWLADELKDLPQANRRNLSARMIQRLGYETADELETNAGNEAERARIVRRLAATLGRP
jgi:hypothetical protein